MRAAVIRDVQRLLRAASLCLSCGKSTLVMNANLARGGYVSEAVTRDTHCTCPGGPAAELVEAVPETPTFPMVEVRT